MISSVRDMARFIQVMNARGRTQGGCVLKAETVEAMITRQNGAIPLDFDFPIGFIWKLYDPELAYAGRFCEHSDDAMIFESMLKILTDHNLGMIVLTNAQEGNPLHEEIARDTFARALERKTGIAKYLRGPRTPLLIGIFLDHSPTEGDRGDFAARWMSRREREPRHAAHTAVSMRRPEAY